MKSGSVFHRMIELRLQGCSREEAIGIATKEVFERNEHASKILKQAIQLYTAYENVLEKIVEEGVLAVEKEFHIEIDDVIIVGSIDIITAKRKMIDLKTLRKNSKSLPDIRHVFQISVYSLTNEADTYYLHYISPNHIDLIQVKPLPMKDVLSIIQSVAKMINMREFPPTGFLTGYCQFCAYKKHCEYHRLTEKPSGGIIERKEEQP